MKTKRLFYGAAIFALTGAIALSSCRKDDKNDNDTSGAEDNALADKAFEDMGQISNEAASGNVNSFKNAGYDGLLSACANVSHDTVNNKITVDFGAVNCLCHDGRYRRGKLFISYTGNSYWDSLASVTISTAKTGDPSSDTYFVGTDQNAMHQVIGTKTITNKGHNLAGHMNWDINVNGKVVKANGQGTVAWQSTRNREWIAGESTPLIWSDDVYGVTGSASGTSAKGTPFTVQITSQLIRKLSPACIRWFSDGKLEFKPGSKPTRYVDFAPPNNGACDNVATVTINNKTYTIYMK